MPAAARVGDMHACPMVNPNASPHTGGPIMPAGCPTVLIGGMPAARASDLAFCAGPPDAIATGCPTVLIGYLQAARQGDPTLHGGVITVGCPTVQIGMAAPAPAAASGPVVIGNMNGMDIVRMPDGTIKVGNGIVIQGDPAFQSAVLKDLGIIAGTPTGQKLLSSIDKSGKTVTIRKTDDGNTENADHFNDGLLKKDGTPGKGSNATVDFNPAKTHIGDGSEPWMKRPTAVGLAHELIHAAHDMNGTTEYDYSDPNKSPQNYELQAVGLKGTKDGNPVDYSGNDFTENKIRSDLGEPERPRY
ncbi:MAG: hypothetical protein C4297_10215 [Gemmataceae bacterium]